MSDLKRYRPMQEGEAAATAYTLRRAGFPDGEFTIVVPDDTLQDIADKLKPVAIEVLFQTGWTCDMHEPTLDCDDCQRLWNEYADELKRALLDGLVNEVAPDQDPNHPNYMGESFVKKLVDGQIALRDSEGEPT